jgi:signal transduction histidine kinase
MRTILFVYLCNLIFISHIAAQQNQLDSLINIQATTTNDSLRALTQLKVGFQYIFKDSDLARKYIDEGYQLSLEKDNHYGIVNGLSIKGIFYDVNGESDSARIHFEKALELSRQFHFPDMEIKLLNNLGMYHWNKGLKTEALTFFHRCLELNPTLPDNKKMDESITQNNIGLIYQELGFYEKALGYHKKALAIRKANPHLQNVVSHSLNNIGICYRNLQQYPESESAYREAMIVCKKLDNQTQYYECMSNLANLYAEMNLHDKSLRYNIEIIEAPKTVKLRSKFLLNLNSQIASNYIHLKKPGKAVEYAEIALSIVEKEPDLKFFASPAYKNASLGYYLLGNTEKGFQYQQQYEKLIEKKFLEDHAGKLAEMETKYNTALKENEILTLKQQNEEAELQIARIELEKNRKNTLLYFTAFFALLVIGGVAVWYRWKQFNTRLRNEQALQNAIFMSEQNERVRIARDLHDSIGQKLSVQKMMISKIISETSDQDKAELTKTSDLIDHTIREVRTISHNLIPAELNLGLLKAIEDTVERMRLAGDVEILLNMNTIQLKDEEFPIDQQITAYRIVQEILNNLLKHAKATRILIDINRMQNQLMVSIEDNGIGFDTRNLLRNEGLGWKNIIARVKFLSGELSIHSQLNEGTFVKLNIPIII